MARFSPYFINIATVALDAMVLAPAIIAIWHHQI
jgi:hypothetical protein